MHVIRWLLPLAVVVMTAPARADSRHLAPDELPPTSLKYTIHAALDPATREIEGTVEIEWAPLVDAPADAHIDAVPIHLYLNAFAHLGTTWIDGATSLRDFDFEKVADRFEAPWGDITPRTIRRLGSAPQDCTWRYIRPDDGNPLDRTLAEIDLDPPLAPGETLRLHIEFDARLPVPVARTGCHSTVGYCHVGQWFPKIALYDPRGTGRRTEAGFAAQQFHGPTEFYAPFADWDVTLDTPAGHVVLATGAQSAAAPPHGDPSAGLQRHRFVQRAVHDFAFVTARQLHVETHAHRPVGGGPPIDITYATPLETRDHVAVMRELAELTFDVMGERVGPYPFGTMKVIEPPFAAVETGGMEYPTLVTGALGDPIADWAVLRDTGLNEDVSSHEIIHNYFQGMVATNEPQEAFLDEGFTSYWDSEVRRVLDARRRRTRGLLGLRIDALRIVRYGLGRAAERIRQPMSSRPAWLFADGTHATQIYTRPDATLTTARLRFGQTAVDRLFRTYFHRHRFGHPTSDDFFTIADEVGPPEMAAFLREGWRQPQIPNYRVAKATTQRWQAPLGLVPSDREIVTVDAANRDERTRDGVGLPPGADDESGGIRVVIRDPGFADGALIVPGGVERRALAPVDLGRNHPDAPPLSDEIEEVEDDDEPKWHRADVTVEGPGWQHLPVKVRFTFADGVVADDEWDGRAPWRHYRFLRRSALHAVRIDPEGHLALEAPQFDNARRLEPDREAAGQWAGWMTRAAQWLALGGAQWL